MIDYTLAVITDAVRIAHILHSVWPDDTADPERIASFIARPDTTTFVAVDGAQVVGFVGGFTTVSAAGERRLEVDLLAVRSSHQGRGIGRELVRRLTDMDSHCDFARALIRIGNVGSERAFAACGYDVEPEPYILFVAEASGQGNGGSADGIYTIPVDTLTYSGLWLEGRRTLDSLRIAPSLATGGQQIVGAVIPVEEVAQLTPESAGYERIGEYRWWRHDYSGRC